MWAVLADLSGYSVPHVLTQILFEAGPRDPLALTFWVGSATRRADLPRSHPKPQLLECAASVLLIASFYY
jgi:hypothetical protein